MTTILIPDSPITTDLTPARIAVLIDQAATLIERDGLEVGGFWTDALLRPYEPGDSCCTVGALAVVCGYRNPVAVEDDFVATSPVYDVPWTPHPVLAAVWAELGFTELEDLYGWSDGVNSERLVVEALRDAAAKIRARAAVA